jgi:N-acetylglucosaminyldiphosphoundecaprenol N-acetyl-beta-D-mannosaminyltransferase
VFGVPREKMKMKDRFSRVTLLGLPFTACRAEDVRCIFSDAINSPCGLCRISTVNLDFLRLADERPAVRETIENCEHRFADGWPILELARIAGHPLPERVTGSGLVPLILNWAREEGWHVALV